MIKTNRILSVDIFRGITVAFMILVNNPGTWGAIFPPLQHAEWHGCTPTDLVFPFFLFIVGTSIVLAYSSKKNTTSYSVKSKIFKRGLKLMLLGLFLAGFTIKFPFFKDIQSLRFPGVLQRIGIVFTIAALLFLHLNKKGLLLAFIGILLGYWALLTQIPIDNSIQLLTKESNLASYIDLKVLTNSHMWKSLYDPEGLLSTLPAIATSIMGMFLGFIITDKKLSKTNKLFYPIYLGLGSILIGYLWSYSFPLNKALWTSSYVLYSGGWAFLSYALIYFIHDIAEIKDFGKSFIYFGSNAITVFFLSGFIAKLFYLIRLPNGSRVHVFIYKTFYESWMTYPKVSSFLYALTVVFFYYLLARVLHKKGVFIKV